MTHEPYEIETDAIADMHVHTRELEQAQEFAEQSAIGGVDVIAPMPNTKTGLFEAHDVNAYADHIIAGRKIKTVVPIALMTEHTTAEHVDNALQFGIRDFKVYPFLRTTKSELHGTKRYETLLPLVELAAQNGQRVHVHPEHPNLLHSNDTAEHAFLPVAEMFLNTGVTLIWEHGTTASCIPFWEEFAKTDRFLVTLTAHHLAINEDDMLGDPSATCKPTYKQGSRAPLLQLVEDDYDWVMAGTDSAPHPREDKFKVGMCCSCGAYCAPFTAAFYAHALNRMLLRRGDAGTAIFRRFTSLNARRLYDLPKASRQIKLVRKPWTIPTNYQVGGWNVMPVKAGSDLLWSLAT